MEGEEDNWKPGYRKRFSLSKLNSAKFPSKAAILGHWKDCFASAIGVGEKGTVLVLEDVQIIVYQATGTG